MEAIDCLRLNRLARTAGAPIDKGAGIKVFKKIGDAVEQGEPIYRIYTFDRVGIRPGAGWREGGQRLHGQCARERRARRVNKVVLQSFEHGAADAERLADALACAVPHKLTSIASPTVNCASRWRGSGDHGPLSAARPAEREADRAHVRRRGFAPRWREAPRAGRALSLLHAPGHCLSPRRGDQPEGDGQTRRRRWWTASSRSTLICTARRTSVPSFQALRPTILPPCRQSLKRCAAINSSTVVVGPDEESQPWVSDLAGRLDLAYAVGRKRRAGDRSVKITFADERLFKGHPVLLVDDIVSSGGTLEVCADVLLQEGATSVDAVVTHALFPMSMMADFTRAGIRSVRSTTACRTRPMHLPSRACWRRLCEQETGIMSVTLRFCGASRTVTGSCYLFETRGRTAAGRLRPVSGPEDTEGIELRRLSLPARRYSCRAADARAYRPQRLAAEADTQRVSRADLRDARYGRSVLLHAAGRRQHPGIRSRGLNRRNAARGAGRKSRRSIRRPMRSPHCRRSGRSTIGLGPMCWKTCARASGTPAISWDRRRSS